MTSPALLAKDPKAAVDRFTLGVLEADSVVADLIDDLVRSVGGSVVRFASPQEISVNARQARLDGVVLRAGPSAKLTAQVFEALGQAGVDVPIIILTEEGEPIASLWPHHYPQTGGLAALSALADTLTRLSKFQAWRGARRDVRDRLASLTSREEEVATRIAGGHFNKEIADDLGISVRTVECHRSRLMRKLGTKSPVELAWLFVIDRLRFSKT